MEISCQKLLVQGLKFILRGRINYEKHYEKQMEKDLLKHFSSVFRRGEIFWDFLILRYIYRNPYRWSISNLPEKYPLLWMSDWLTRYQWYLICSLVISTINDCVCKHVWPRENLKKHCLSNVFRSHNIIWAASVFIRNFLIRKTNLKLLIRNVSKHKF